MENLKKLTQKIKINRAVFSTKYFLKDNSPREITKSRKILILLYYPKHSKNLLLLLDKDYKENISLIFLFSN